MLCATSLCMLSKRNSMRYGMERRFANSHNPTKLHKESIFADFQNPTKLHKEPRIKQPHKETNVFTKPKQQCKKVTRETRKNTETNRSKDFVGNRKENRNLRNNVIKDSQMGKAVLAAINASFKTDHE